MFGAEKRSAGALQRALVSYFVVQTDEDGSALLFGDRGRILYIHYIEGAKYSGFASK